MEREVFLQFLCAAAFGGVYALFICLLVNMALVAIATNQVFAVYFGLMFMLLGATFLCRIYRSPISSDRDTSSHRPLLLMFALMVFASGVFCFVVERNIFDLSVGTRVPIFLLLGVSVCFALTFFSLDVINVFIGMVCTRLNRHRFIPGIVETPSQVYLILASSIIMGAIFGLIFGLLDMEDAGDKLGKKLWLEEEICFPVAFLLGASAGVLNQKRSVGYTYSLVPESAYDDGI